MKVWCPEGSFTELNCSLLLIGWFKPHLHPSVLKLRDESDLTLRSCLCDEFQVSLRLWISAAEAQWK